MEKKYLVRFDFGLRNAFGESLEVLNEEDMQLLKKSILEKQEVYLGEIEGKHSEIYGPIEDGEYKIISEDMEEIAVFEKLLDGWFGAFHLMGRLEDAIKGR